MQPIIMNRTPKYIEKNEFIEISTKAQFTIIETTTPMRPPVIADIVWMFMPIFNHFYILICFGVLFGGFAELLSGTLLRFI